MSMGMHDSGREWKYRRQQEPGRIVHQLDSAETPEELDTAIVKARNWIKHYPDTIVVQALERAEQRRA